MNFLYPWAFLLAGLVPVVVALYLQRRRRRYVEVSTLLFWQRLMEKEPHRKFLGRLRHPFSLLLQLLIFLLLLLAIVRPEFRAAGAHGSLVVILDARARMQADQGQVFSRAVAEARRLLSLAGPDQEIALLAVQESPFILSPFSSDPKLLRERLAGLTPMDGGGSLEGTLSLARQILAGRTGDKKLVVMTDRPVPDAQGVEQVLVGQPRDNLAVLALSQRSLPASPQSAEVFVRLANFSTSSLPVEMELSLDNRILDVQKLTLAPGENRSLSSIVPAEVLRAGQGLLQARLNSTDALGVDDVARAALPIGHRLRTLLVGAEDVFLEQALKADPSVDLEILRPEAWKPGMGAGFDLALFDGVVPEGVTLETEKAAFFFGQSPLQATAPEKCGFLLERAGAESPLLWNVDTSELRLRALGKLNLPTSPWRSIPVLEAGGEPALVTLENPGGSRLVVSAFGVGDSNLPLRAGFPLLISNVVHWLAHTDSFVSALRAGDVFVPAQGEHITLLDSSLPSVGEGDSSIALPLRKNGFYEVKGGSANRWLGVSTADAEESDLRKSSFNHAVLPLAGSWAGWRFWQWCALLTLGLFFLEWALHHQRVTE